MWFKVSQNSLQVRREPSVPETDNLNLRQDKLISSLIAWETSYVGQHNNQGSHSGSCVSRIVVNPHVELTPRIWNPATGAVRLSERSSLQMTKGCTYSLKRFWDQDIFCVLKLECLVALCRTLLHAQLGVEPVGRGAVSGIQEGDDSVCVYITDNGRTCRCLHAESTSFQLLLVHFKPQCLADGSVTESGQELHQAWI